MSDEITMTISIPSDDDGYVLLKCEYCGTYFKASPSDIQSDEVLHIYCPCCGLTGESYFTEDAIELAEKILLNQGNNIIYEAFKQLEKQTKKSFVQFKAGKKPKYEIENPIRSGIEAMEETEFPCCKRSAKIKPLLRMTGAYCPFCGVKNYEIE